MRLLAAAMALLALALVAGALALAPARSHDRHPDNPFGGSWSPRLVNTPRATFAPLRTA
jgi:hypothetical protein